MKKWLSEHIAAVAVTTGVVVILVGGIIMAVASGKLGDKDGKDTTYDDVANNTPSYDPMLHETFAPYLPDETDENGAIIIPDGWFESGSHEVPPTENPTEPSGEDGTEPTEDVTEPSGEGSTEPGEEPTTTKPSENPTTKPSEKPTTKPSEKPTTKPSENPTTKPSESTTDADDDKPLAEKYPQYVYGRYLYEKKTVGGKTAYCFYAQPVSSVYDSSDFDDMYYIEWNEDFVLYVNKGTSDWENTGNVGGFLEHSEEYEGMVLNASNSHNFAMTGNVMKKSHYVNGVDIGVRTNFIMPFNYDEKAQTVTKNGTLISRDLYVSFIRNYLNKRYGTLTDAQIDGLCTDAGNYYDVYIYWKTYLVGTEFECLFYASSYAKGYGIKGFNICEEKQVEHFQDRVAEGEATLKYR